MGLINCHLITENQGRLKKSVTPILNTHNIRVSTNVIANSITKYQKDIND